MKAPSGWQFIGPYTVPEPRHLVSEIQDHVARYYCTPPEMMRSPNRDRRFARPRQVAMWLAKRFTKQSLPEIGRRFNREHTTVLFAVRQIDRMRSHDPELANDLRIIASRMGGRA